MLCGEMTTPEDEQTKQSRTEIMASPCRWASDRGKEGEIGRNNLTAPKLSRLHK